MALNDILPYRAEHGGHDNIAWFPVTSGATFVKGEPVRLAAAGTVSDTADPVADINNFLGIAAGPGTGVAFVQKYGAFTPGGGTIAAGDLVPVYLPAPDQLWITQNFGTSTGVFGIAPTQLMVGDVAAVIEDATGLWGLNTADESGANIIARVVNVLDAQMNPISYTGKIGVYVVFTLSTGQIGSQPITTAPADPGA